MKTFRILGVAFFAVFAVCALDVVAAAPAMAEEVCVELLAQTSLWEPGCNVKLATADSLFELVKFLLALWLRNGVEITTELTTESTGELLLEDTASGVALLCSRILDGWVGPNSLDWVSEALTLGGLAVKELVETEAIECTRQAGTCESPLVWPKNLPWETEVELWETETALFGGLTSGFAVLILPHAGGGNPGWEVDCLVPLLGLVEDLCTAPVGVFELSLNGTELLGNFSEEFTELMGGELATCEPGGGKTGIVEGGGTIALTVGAGGGELTASSETAEA
jgi:hypothetical protein